MTADDHRLRVVLELKSGLTDHATGGVFDAQRYQAIRTELMRASWAKGMRPSFLRTCRDLDDFWSFIKSRFAHYQERRQFLREEFDPLLTALEQASLVPVDGLATGLLTKVDSAHVYDFWQKALDRRERDPEGAVTAARSLLETVCKHILDDLGVTYSEDEKLPKLYGKVAQGLNLAPSQHEEHVFKQILGGCQTVVDSLGAIRNRLSDAHGRGSRAARPAPRHAGLAVNLAGTMAGFLVETWESRLVAKELNQPSSGTNGSGGNPARTRRKA